MEKITINIIEDNKVIRDNLIKFIGFHDDLEVYLVANSVEDYLRQLSNNKNNSNILLLDIGLPGMSGLDGIPLIKEKNPDIDIIMLTTYEEEAMIVKALCSGACSYISKKTSLKEIVDAIRIVKSGGSYMSPSIAREIVTYLMGGRISKATILTERQREILQRLTDGKSYNEIGKELFLSMETIKSHVKKIYQTLHVNNKSEAIAKYLKGEIT
jgi:two-component system, NarL family, response regulator LiaR